MAAAIAQRIRVGVIGLSTQGWASWGLVPPMLKLKDNPYKIVAICTARQKTSEQLDEIRAKFGHDLKVYATPQEMANAPDVDLIVIAVKAPEHEKTLMPAIDASLTKKKDIFIEWPATGKLEVCQMLAGQADQLGIRVIVGLQGRQSPTLKKLRDIVRAENGEKGIGNIVSSVVIGCAGVESLYWGPRVSESSSYVTDSKNGATMLHVMIGHLLDPFLRIFGDIDTVSTTQTIAFPNATVCDGAGNPTGKTLPVSTPDQLSFSGLTKSNMHFTFHYRAGVPLLEGRTNFLWLIDGTEGSIRLEGKGRAGSFVNIVDPTLFLDGQQIDVPADPLGNIGRAWAEIARGAGGDYATVEDGVKVLRVVDAVMKSAEKKAAMSVN